MERKTRSRDLEILSLLSNKNIFKYASLPKDSIRLIIKFFFKWKIFVEILENLRKIVDESEEI